MSLDEKWLREQAALEDDSAEAQRVVDRYLAAVADSERLGFPVVKG